jgi:AbrB family looped-hinge helix DNA binding protein
MESASSRITTKFQTTIPKLIREHLKLSAKDTLDWQIDDDKITVRTNKKPFMRHRNRIKIGPGEIENDRELARQRRMEKYR